MKPTERSRAIKEGMREAEAEGRHIGRPEGSRKTASEILADYPEVAEVLGEGLSLRAVATRCGVSVNTVRKVKTALADLGRLENERRAAPSSSLPLRFTATYLCDWRRNNGKEGELLQCGHFVSHKGEVLDETKARRCQRCAEKKEKGGPLYAVSLLHRSYNYRRNDLQVTYYRPALVHAESEAHALMSVRKAVGWRTLPEGCEAWQVEDPKTIGADTLSPRTVKALALLEANRVLVWKGWGDGAIHTFDIGRVETEGRARLRLSEAECRALESLGYLVAYKRLMRGGYGPGAYPNLSFFIEEVTQAWLLADLGRQALEAHDRRAKVTRRYHGVDEQFFEW